MKPNLLLLLFISVSAISITIAQSPLPIESSTLFSGSGNCATCHESDGTALTYNGEDVSMVTYWRSTMMANASKDPLWRAYVSEETESFPMLQELIETKCTTCHAPMGYYEAIFNGASSYSMDELKQDPLANDGVSCTVCHQINPSNFGDPSSYSGGYIITDERIIYGPYENPDTLYMQGFVNYTPVYSTHLNQSELCATCHTLFTPTVDDQGNIVGDFPEQTPYIEWKNSIYPAEDIPCQSCHMPRIYDPIDIASIPQDDTTMRSPFWKHTFVGGNIILLNILKNNLDSLHVSAFEEQIDSTISRALFNLRQKAINLEVTANYVNDSLSINVKIENLTGHKIPTGIPLRRMWIHLRVEDQSGNKLFESGNYNSDGVISGINNDYEPHYNLIDSEDQVQIYEGVLQDLNDQVTYTLLKAASYKKDNRIPPKGFTSSHLSYDTTAITGNALYDDNFNIADSVEGSGSDIVTYRIPVLLFTEYKIITEICYQTIKTEAIDHLSGFNGEDVIAFLGLYEAADKLPVVMKSDTLDLLVTSISDNNSRLSEFRLEQNYPNPFNPNTYISWKLPAAGNITLKVYDILGREVKTLVDGYKPAGTYETEFDASGLPSGIYYYRLTAGSYKAVKKMILLR
ncbi:MAG: hypothetical protein Kow0098_05430 [Ignavibacteriaceae bacterium]